MKRYLMSVFMSIVLITSVPVAYASSGALVIDGSWEPAGYTQVTDVSSAVGIGTVPAGARMAMVQAEAFDVRWRDDGTNPTAAVGNLLEAGQTLVYNGRLGSIKFIEVSAGAILNVSFYR